MESTKESFRDHYDNLSVKPKSATDAESELRGREMAADPMLEYFREKKRAEQGTQSKPTYNGPFPPNRYNIKPGYRWDGVDRSNGHEKKLMEKQAEKKAREEDRQAAEDLYDSD